MTWIELRYGPVEAQARYAFQSVEIFFLALSPRHIKPTPKRSIVPGSGTGAIAELSGADVTMLI